MHVVVEGMYKCVVYIKPNGVRGFRIKQTILRHDLPRLIPYYVAIREHLCSILVAKLKGE